jgi:hypothetical protein
MAWLRFFESFFSSRLLVGLPRTITFCSIAMVKKITIDGVEAKNLNF